MTTEPYVTDTECDGTSFPKCPHCGYEDEFWSEQKPHMGVYEWEAGCECGKRYTVEPIQSFVTVPLDGWGDDGERRPLNLEAECDCFADFCPRHDTEEEIQEAKDLMTACGRCAWYQRPHAMDTAFCRQTQPNKPVGYGYNYGCKKAPEWCPGFKAREPS